jgi:hypothetical protein
MAYTLTRLAPPARGSAPSPALRERGDRSGGPAGEGISLGLSYFFERMPRR